MSDPLMNRLEGVVVATVAMTRLARTSRDTASR